MCPRTPEQNKEIRAERKQLIMDVALKLFSIKGYHATSISSIAEQVKISKGLIYNYFDSKQDLLLSIMHKVSDEIMDMMNPDHDDEITTQELTDFFDLLFESLKNKREYWKLYFQLSMQSGVIESMYNEEYLKKATKNQQLIYKHFAERYENADEIMLIVTSIIKGYALQYVFSPELFSNDLSERVKMEIKKLFIKPKIYNYEANKLTIHSNFGFNLI